MAVRIVRQPKQIVLLGAPTSAAALAAGHERAPQALRAAGLVERLQSLGYNVTDMGDDAVAMYQPDEESPRARNLPRVVKALEALKPRVEAAVKTGGLPLIISGDCSSALAVIAGVRRYYRGASIVYMDRDADLNIPATSPSGCVDGMVVSHLTGRGAAEMIRFWGEPPLVRDPDVALFGVDRLDPPEEEMLSRFPIRIFRANDIQRMGAVAAAEMAVERIHGGKNELVVHLDVDVIASEDFQATDLPGAGGLRLEEVRQALEVFAKQGRLVAFEVTAYNPERDNDGRGAKTIIDLIAAALGARLQSQAEPATVGADTSALPTTAAGPAEPSASEPHATDDSPATDSPEQTTSASGE
ncbi:MAG TPA: arginase family protein [Candidatus Acidoferrales bacterium]|nr:arginase family protein [Candidatus Acidoferrales bacterium]HEV3481075.1 arginase family protein [Candidatus Acidoferrales bacterium]